MTTRTTRPRRQAPEFGRLTALLVASLLAATGFSITGAAEPDRGPADAHGGQSSPEDAPGDDYALDASEAELDTMPDPTPRQDPTTNTASAQNELDRPPSFSPTIGR